MPILAHSFTALTELTDAQYQALTNIASGLIGAASSVAIQWIAKRRTPVEEGDDHADNQTKAASQNVATALQVNNMLENLLEKERNYFQNQIEESRKACAQQIENLRESLSEEYDDIINKMKKENKNVTDELTRKIIELRARLSKYETESITGKHTAITPEDIAAASQSNDKTSK